MSDNGNKGKPEPVVPLVGDDVFWLTDLYPDAKALFDHEQVSLADAAKDSIVALDANVLLLPFEITSASVGEVERVYNLLCGASRLVVPGQAAREYYKQRSIKIGAIADKLDGSIKKARSQVIEKLIPLLEGDDDFKSAHELSKEVQAKGREIVKKLEAVNERLKDDLGRDRVSLLYRKLLGGCVAEVPLSTKEERQAVSEEVARRARLQIAPGYKDQNKADGGIGDYLVWRAILQVGAERQTHCIFVTEEEKADWWIRRNGTFQPRPELIDEYSRASGGKSLHLVPLSGLLEAFETSKEIVKEVQDVEEKKRVEFTVTPANWERLSSVANLMPSTAYYNLNHRPASHEADQLFLKYFKQWRSGRPDLMDDDLREAFLRHVQSVSEQTEEELDEAARDVFSRRVRDYLTLERLDRLLREDTTIDHFRPKLNKKAAF